MAYMVPKLNYRGTIYDSENDPNEEGGFDTELESLVTVWMGVRKESDYIRALRGVQREEGETHILLVRKIGVVPFGQQFSSAFDSSFNIQSDINPLKTNNFILLHEDTNSENKGRLMRIVGTNPDYKHKEFMEIYTEEWEERGTGYKSVPFS